MVRSSAVGDAGYHRDPITGHGMSDAFRDAELLARALDGVLAGDVGEAEALARYDADRRRALAPIFDLTTELATFPEPSRFLHLQHELNAALEAEAAELAALLPLAGALAGV